jgi:hypothetical protein
MHRSELEDSGQERKSLAALAEQLRDGALQELIELQRRATEFANRNDGTSNERLRDLEGLVRLSLSAMDHFHAFTREFQSVLRDLTDARTASH